MSQLKLTKSWSVQENKVMEDIMLMGIQNGYKLVELYKIVSDVLDRSVDSVRGRWETMKFEIRGLVDLSKMIWIQQNKPELENNLKLLKEKKQYEKKKRSERLALSTQLKRVSKQNKEPLSIGEIRIVGDKKYIFKHEELKNTPKSELKKSFAINIRNSNKTLVVLENGQHKLVI